MNDEVLLCIEEAVYLLTRVATLPSPSLYKALVQTYLLLQPPTLLLSSVVGTLGRHFQQGHYYVALFLVPSHV